MSGDRGRFCSAVRAALPSATWCALCLLGSCVLLPYNVLLTTQAFFDEHAFVGMKFPFASMLVYSSCLCVSQVALAFRGESLSLRMRTRVSFVLAMVACTLLAATAVVGAMWPRSVWVYCLCLLGVAIMAVSNSLLQTAVLGVTGAMGPEESGAVMVGLSAGGLLTLGLALLVQAVERMGDGVDEDSGAAGAALAAVLFAICIAFNALSSWVYNWLSQRASGASYVIKALERAREERCGALLAAAAEGYSPGARAFFVLRMVWPQALNVSGIFVVSMCVFPGVLTKWEPAPGSVFAGSRQLYATLLVGAFQVFDVLSRFVAGWAARKTPPEALCCFVLSRVVFVPLFILGQRRPEVSALWGSDAGRFALSSALAFTNGLGASMAMMFGPARAPAELREAAGMAMSAVMVVGILVGSLLAFLTQVGTTAAVARDSGAAASAIAAVLAS